MIGVLILILFGMWMIAAVHFGGADWLYRRNETISTIVEIIGSIIGLIAMFSAIAIGLPTWLWILLSSNTVTIWLIKNDRAKEKQKQRREMSKQFIVDTTVIPQWFKSILLDILAALMAFDGKCVRFIKKCKQQPRNHDKNTIVARLLFFIFQGLMICVR